MIFLTFSDFSGFYNAKFSSTPGYDSDDIKNQLSCCATTIADRTEAWEKKGKSSYSPTGYIPKPSMLRHGHVDMLKVLLKIVAVQFLNTYRLCCTESFLNPDIESKQVVLRKPLLVKF